jgi:hypothetical protein
MKLVHEPVGSTDFKYWAASLKEFPVDQLDQGLRKAQDWSGFLTLGDFRKLCEKEQSAPYHKEYQALPHKSMEGTKLQKKIRKMRKELGV